MKRSHRQSNCPPPKLLCGGLNDNGPQRLIYLKARSTVSATILEGSGGVALLVGVYR